MEDITLSAPALLRDDHKLDKFTCGVDTLDNWLKRCARANQVSGASRTYVIAEGRKVMGYYSLASGSLALNVVPGNVRRNMPDPIPMAIVGRLAVDQSWQNHGLGTALLQDAVARTAKAARIIGIRGLFVHALSDDAKVFYIRNGFTVSPQHPMTLIMSLGTRQ